MIPSPLLLFLISLLISPSLAYTAPPKSSKNSVKISSQCRRTFLSKITILTPAAATLTFSNEASAAAAGKDNNNDMTVSNYIRQVFGSPLVGTTPNNTPRTIPVVTDDTINTTREERNRAYDEAFQQDARNLDAYYGQMAIKKRQETNQNIKQYRESLGLDGKGDVRMRVGEERVQGLASLRELKADYLSSLEEGREGGEEQKMNNE
jgi:hypothetical protein